MRKWKKKNRKKLRWEGYLCQLALSFPRNKEAAALQEQQQQQDPKSLLTFAVCFKKLSLSLTNTAPKCSNKICPKTIHPLFYISYIAICYNYATVSSFRRRISLGRQASVITLVSWMPENTRMLPCDPAKRGYTILLEGEAIRDPQRSTGFCLYEGICPWNSHRHMETMLILQPESSFFTFFSNLK